VHKNVEHGIVPVHDKWFFVFACTCGAWAFGYDEDPQKARETARDSLFQYMCGKHHSNCNGVPKVLDGELLKAAGIEGGDMLYCAKCQWMGRPE
jgi:hypothetical protein